jgi:hypothetical protein
MPTALEQCLLFHRREKITNKIDKIQKKNYKENEGYAQFFFIFLSLAFFLSLEEKQKSLL